MVDISHLCEQDQDLVKTLIARLNTKDANAYEYEKAYNSIYDVNGLWDRYIEQLDG